MVFTNLSSHLNIVRLVLCAAVACGGSGGDTAETTSTGADASTSATGEAPTTGDPASSTSSVGSADTTAPTVTTTAETGVAETGVAATDTATTDAPATTGDETTAGVDDCTLEHHACALAAQLGDYEDCGSLLLTDDAATWQAGNDCVIAAASEERAFKLVTESPGIDSALGEAFIGQEARSYMLTRMFFDSDPCGGGCDPVVTAYPCMGLLVLPDCVAEPGFLCIFCDGAGDDTQVCGP